MEELLKEIEEKMVKVDKEYLEAYNKLNEKSKELSIMEKVELTTKLNYYGGQKVALNYVAMRIKAKEEK